MRERLGDDAVVASGAGNYSVWVHSFFQFRRHGTQLAPKSGAMGFGLPAALAAKVVHPKRTVVAVAGDGDFVMCGHELATAVQHGLDVVVLVVDNGMYGTIRMHQERAYPGRVIATDLQNPDFAALDELDLTLKLSREEEAARLEAASNRLLELRLTLGGLLGDGRLGPPVCVVFEGWDASGKGGAIRRLVTPMDPRHVRVASFAAPTYDEKRHHFLWRFWSSLPGWGGMAVLDRSWYGRVLAERVPGLRRDRRVRAVAGARGDDPAQVLDAHLRRGAAAPVQAARVRAAEDLEADRRGLAQPRESHRLRAGDRGHAGADRPPAGPLAPGRGRLQALRQGPGGGDGHRRDRAGHARPRLRPPTPPPQAGRQDPDQDQGQIQGQGRGQGRRRARLTRGVRARFERGCPGRAGTPARARTTRTSRNLEASRFLPRMPRMFRNLTIRSKLLALL